MWSKLQQIASLAKACGFSIVVHGLLIVLLSVSFNWTPRIEVASSKPIPAVLVDADWLEADKTPPPKQPAPASVAEAEKKIQAQKQQQQEIEKKRQAKLRKQKQLEAKRKKEIAQRAAEKQRLEAVKKKKLAAEKRKKQAQKLAQAQRAKTKKAASDALSALQERIKAKVTQNWRQPRTNVAGLSAIIHVKVDPSGRVIFAKVRRSSGDSFFDGSAELAVQKSSPLPFPPEPKYYEFINDFHIKFQPR